MENKIQELTDKIYKEGVEKGNAQAKQLLEDAQKQAEAIIAKANTEAERIISKAQEDAKDLKANTESEIKMYASQALNALKTEVTNLINGNIVEANVKAFVDDKKYLNEFIVELAKNWSKDEAITISSNKAEELKEFFNAKAKELLDKGVKIEKVNGKNALFSISPADGGYKVNFGEEEFENYFKEFLRPQLIKLLFNEN